MSWTGSTCRGPSTSEGRCRVGVRPTARVRLVTGLLLAATLPASSSVRSPLCRRDPRFAVVSPYPRPVYRSPIAAICSITRTS